MVLSDVILVIGLGSPIMSDDAVGLKVAERKIPGVETRQEAIGGLDIIPVLYGYRNAVIVDAIKTGAYPPGTILIFDPEDFEPTVGDASAHSINLATAMHMGRSLDPENMPESVRFVAVEVEDIQTVSETMTYAVEKAVPKATDAVIHIIEEFRSRCGRC
jgi:hydrogenase maturation protease